MKKKTRNILIIIVGIAIILGVGAYSFATANINYNKEQSQEIALQRIPGEVTDIETEFEIEDITLEYTFLIIDEENVMQEVTVNSKSGAITGIN
ncbi:PepSY domain-containing protein [Carnobacterium iners]|nr:PepSY domain-containing protein [Carnobacterium iners]